MRKSNSVIAKFYCYDAKKARELEHMIHDMISNYELAGDLVESATTAIVHEKQALRV